MLSDVQTSFLESYKGDGGEHGIGICYCDADEKFVTLQGYGCAPSRRGEFVKQAPPHLYLWGVAVVVELRSGIVVSPDRRGGGRTMATGNGWSAAGEEPEEATRRECRQEVFAWLDGMDLPVGDPRRLERVQLVPRGITPFESVPMLNLSLTGHREVGELEYVGVNVSETAKVVEFISKWRLGDCLEEDEETLLRMIWTEQMDADKSYLGTNFMVLNPETGEYVGTFCGRQPLLDLRTLGKHPALAKYLELRK